MHIIDSTEAMNRALDLLTDSRLKQLLATRRDQLIADAEDRYELDQLAHFLVVEPPDCIADLERVLGTPILTNPVGGSRYGDLDFEPSWEWIQGHDGWFELVYILTDDGFASVILVPDHEGIDPVLLSMCRTYAGARTANSAEAEDPRPLP